LIGIFAVLNIIDHASRSQLYLLGFVFCHASQHDSYGTVQQIRTSSRARG